jgi:hypothetical protein
MKKSTAPIAMNLTPFRPIQSFASHVTLQGKETLRVVKDSTVVPVDEPTFARLIAPDFQNGCIEVNVLSRLLPDAPDYARGFIGVAFRIDEHNTKFEGLYLRPTNGRAEDQVRRNRATQYFSYPAYKFDRLRDEAPGKYESYADMGLDEWIKMRIEVENERARLFLNEGAHPVLVVNDLKLGTGAGGIGLWVEIGTEGFFADLKVETR